MTNCYSTDFLSNINFNGIHTPKQSTIDAILQFAEIYPVQNSVSSQDFHYLYSLKN